MYDNEIEIDIELSSSAADDFEKVWLLLVKLREFGEQLSGSNRYTYFSGCVLLYSTKLMEAYEHQNDIDTAVKKLQEMINNG